MCRNSLGFILIATVLMLLESGCKKAEPEGPTPKVPTSTPSAPNAQPATVLRLRWLGTKRLLTETNAAGFGSIWTLPETQTLEAQTLNRLALFLTGGKLINIASTVSTVGAAKGGTNQSVAGSAGSGANPSPLLPVLDDLMSEESYWEAQQTPGKPGELAVAIRLSNERAKLWQTNLTAAFGSMTPAVSSLDSVQWQLTNLPASKGGGTPGPRTLELSRAGDWTVVGLAVGSNALARQFASRIQAQTLFQAGTTNFWLTATIHPGRLDEALALGLGLPEDLPAISLAVIGDGVGVHTRAQLDFLKALPDKLEAWSIPTNLVHDPLVSFLAIRGVSSWVSKLEPWKDLGVGVAPDQVYLWAQSGSPFLSYCAAPNPNASNIVGGLTRDLVGANPWMDTNGIGSFEKATNFDGAIWKGLNIITPCIEFSPSAQGGFVFAALDEQGVTNRPMPAELVGAILSQTNLMAYDWELTGLRIEQWLYFGQFVRFALHKAQIPPKSASFALLTALSQRLGNCVTTASQTGPNQISIGRKSDVGLTAAELDWLADWIESPQFPLVLNTFAGRPERLPMKRPASSHTNSVPAVHH